MKYLEKIWQFVNEYPLITAVIAAFIEESIRSLIKGRSILYSVQWLFYCFKYITVQIVKFLFRPIIINVLLDESFNHFESTRANYLLKGKWELSYTIDNITHTEEVEINFLDEYFANGVKTFKLKNVKVNISQKTLKMTKYRISQKRPHTTESLVLTNNNSLSGTDNLGCQLEYRKIN